MKTTRINIIAVIVILSITFISFLTRDVNISYAQSIFEDVPSNHWAYEFINTVSNNQVMNGCSSDPNKFCPDALVTRGEIAKIIELSIHKNDPYFQYSPYSGIFSDVPSGSSDSKFIEQLYIDGITTGCNVNPFSYCPDRYTTRAEMAVLLLRGKYGRNFTPPAPTGTMFSDVPKNFWGVAWIEELAREGITTGCAKGIFCPSRQVTRAEVAVFISRTFFNNQISDLPPSPSTSYYIKTTNPDAMFDIGCKHGQRDVSLAGSQESLIILAFGKPRDFGGGVYGARLYGPLGPVTISEVSEASKAFGLGYLACSIEDPNSQLEIAIGTSNYYYPGEDNQVTYDHGKAWASMVNNLNNWYIVNKLFGKVKYVGASDIELSWNTPQVTRNWVGGYDSVNTYPLYNFGAVEGCPTRLAPDWNCANSWTQEDVWYVSFGNGASYPVPEIYATSGVNARQWAWMSVYGYDAHSLPLYFKGVLTTYQACLQRGGCSGIDNTPSQGWQQLFDEINKDSRTSQNNLKYLTDIKWYGE